MFFFFLTSAPPAAPPGLPSLLVHYSAGCGVEVSAGGRTAERLLFLPIPFASFTRLNNGCVGAAAAARPGDADGERVITETPAADGWQLSCKFSPWEPAGRE